MVSYERLSPADAPLLSSIGGITLLQSHGHSAPAEVMQEYVNSSFHEAACRGELSEAQNIFTAVYYNGQLAGYSKLVVDTPHPSVPLQPVTKLERMYLLDEFFGLGLGKGLLEQCIHHSQTKGDKGMWLDVWKGNDRAIRFYKKQGFETVDEGRFVLTETHFNPKWVMLLRY
jgi:ribosomal protein S18 acetylase RimI-like enzyme